MARQRRLTVVPASPATPPAAEPLITGPKAAQAAQATQVKPIAPKAQVKLHPAGCRCNFHDPAGAWATPWRREVATTVLPAGPRLVLWDVENWQGTPDADMRNVDREWRFCRDALGLTRSDYVVFGLSHFTYALCRSALPANQAAVVLGSGQDGADRALIDAADLQRLSRHYTTLVVVSNDHIFTELAAQAKALGMTTWQVSTDLSWLSKSTRAAFDGWTHIKLKAFRRGFKAALKAREERRAA
jgi:hypothetical protein